MLLWGELGVVARCQHRMLVGDFNVEPTKIPCLAKGISAGLILMLLWRWLVVGSLLTLVSVIGVLVVVTEGTLWWGPLAAAAAAAAAVLSCKVQPDRWIAPHLAVRALFDCCRWTCRVTQPVQRTPLWPASLFACC